MHKRLFVTVFAAAAVSLLGANFASAQNTVNCSEEDVTAIRNAQVYGGLTLLTVGRYLTDLRAGGDPARFDYWFGNHDTQMVDAVEYTLMLSYQSIDELTYNCECNAGPDTYAYVNSGERFQMHMCPAFFDATDLNTDIIGTFVHELTHLHGTQDCMSPIAICQPTDPVPNSASSAHEFALRDPATASRNAYNLERFVTDAGRPR